MTISVTQNPDGTIHVSCGTDELTFVPQTASASLSATGASSPSSTAGGTSPPTTGTGGKPIPSGHGHKAFLYIGGGSSASDPAIPLSYSDLDYDEFERELQAIIATKRKPQQISSVQLNVNPGVTIDVAKILATANRTAADQSSWVQLWITPISPKK